MRKILFILIILTILNAQRIIPLQKLVIPAINPINPEDLSQDKIFVTKLIWGNHDKNSETETALDITSRIFINLY